MYNAAELNLEKAFAKEGAKLRFRKLIGLNEASDEDVDDMVAENDASAFLGHLQGVDQPGSNTGSGRTLTVPEPKTKDFMCLLVQLTKGAA
jgi:hypothetical protein